MRSVVRELGVRLRLVHQRFSLSVTQGGQQLRRSEVCLTYSASVVGSIVFQDLVLY